MRVSLAKTLASLESRQVYLREPEVGFTAKSCASLAWLDQSSCSWKTYQQSFLTDSEPYLETWPRWGMTQGGCAYAHPMSERRITETDGLHFVPTPDTQNHRDGTKTRKDCNIQHGGMHGVSLHHYIAMWPTPQARDFRSGDAPGSPRAIRKATQGWGANLNDAVKMWPTPTAHNAKETNAPSEANRNTPTLAAQAGGQLNPDFVAWLMAFPIGWASLKATAMPKCHCKPQPLTACSVESELELTK